MNKNLQISFKEAKHVLKYLTKEEKDKIPVKIRRFITDYDDNEHVVDMNKLSKRTYALLAVIYRKYLAENKQQLEQEHQNRLRNEKIQFNKIAKQPSSKSNNDK